jgi:Fe2+ transport system protein FeoA
MMSLIDAPRDKRLRIVDIQGTEGVRRRLLSLGIHTGDFVEVCSQALFGGPVLVKDQEKGTCIAISRGIARKIRVDVVDTHE